MRIAVIGAGAIGTVVAAAASATGHQVVVCTRTPIEEVRLESEGRETALSVTIASSVSDLPAAATDMVWVTTKATDTTGAGPWLDALLGSSTVVASAQNGLDHRSRLSTWVPPERVAPALAYIAAERLGPGRVRHIAGNLLVVPEEFAPQISDAVVGGGMTVRGTSDMVTASWRKLLGNVVANPITALTRRRIGVMREDEIASLGRRILSEAIEVGKAEGARLSADDLEKVLGATTTYGDATGSSMYYDVMAGRRLEHQFLTGEIVRRGRSRGIDVSVNATILALLDALDSSPNKS